MKPPPFDYFRPVTLAEAAELLAAHCDAKILAGGQSLVPLMNFRMVRPAALIDINRLTELDFIREEGSGLRIGALARHCALETSPLVRTRFPVLAEAVAQVGHPAIRNRGTLGGSLAHADPAAELPLLAVLLDAEIETLRQDGPGRHPAADFFRGPLTTVLADDEVVAAVTLPALPRDTGAAFAEVAMRHGDFAIAAAAAAVTAAGGRIAAVRLAVTGIGDTPLRLRSVEAGLAGQPVTPELLSAAGAQASEAVRPQSDPRASADYRRHLVGVLSRRVLATAWSRAAASAG